MVYASVGTKEELLHYVGVQLYINEQKVVPKDVQNHVVNPFIIDGTTYLPVRAVAESFGKKVAWDEATSSVSIDDGGEKKIESSSQEERYQAELTKTLHYRDIKIFVNQTMIEPKDANGKVVEPFIIEGTTYLPVRAISEAFGYQVDWNGETKSVLITNPQEMIEPVISGELLEEPSGENIQILEEPANDITVLAERKSPSAMYHSGDFVSIINIKAMKIEDVIVAEVVFNAPLKEYHSDVIEDPDRIIVDLSETQFAINRDDFVISNELIQKIRFGVHEENFCRIVFDLKNKTNYTVLQSQDKMHLYLAFCENYSLDNILKATENAPRTVQVEKQPDVIVQENISGDEVITQVSRSGDIIEENSSGELNPNDLINSNEINGDTTTNIQKQSGDVMIDKSTASGDETSMNVDELAIISSVKYSATSDKIKLKIEGNYEYHASYDKDKSQVLIDIENATLKVSGPHEIKPNNKNITRIQFDQLKQNVVRFSVTVKKETSCEFSKSNSLLSIEVVEPIDSLVEFQSYANYDEVILKEAKAKWFDIENITNKKRLVITYSSSSFVTNKQKITAETDLVDFIEVTAIKTTIYYNQEIDYSIEQKGSNVVVTIKKVSKSSSAKIEEPTKTPTITKTPIRKKASGERVVILDAGHGGIDPGAVNGSYQEKTYNLKITLKVYELLKDVPNLQVRLMRDSDVYLPVNERLDKFIEYGDADLIVSIHHNSLDRKDYQGTMVLYYNKPNEKEDYGITSKEFATIVKDKLIQNLGTIDRGIVNRPDLLVLCQNTDGKDPGKEYTNVPAILCEIGFLSNPEELSRIITDSFQTKAAKAIYDGVMEALDRMNE